MSTMGVLAAPAATAGATDLSAFYDQKPQWAPCELGGPPTPGLLCATIEVPMDYRHPAGRRIPLAISKLPAKDPAHRQGVLLVNPGGPGDWGQDLPMTYSDRPIAQDFDMIGFNPRGTGGGSAEVFCEADPNAVTLPSRPTDDQFALYTQQARTAEAGCRQDDDGLRPFVNTPNTARDMDVIRGVLGEKKINYLGVSYGTYLGAVYGSLFPGKLNRSVLDSSINPDWVWRDVWRQQAVAARANVDELFTWLGERNSVYGLGKSHDEVHATSEALAAKLGTAPITDPRFGTVTQTDYDYFVLGYLSRARGAWDSVGEEMKALSDAADGKLALGSPALVDAGTAVKLMKNGVPGDYATNGTYDTITCEADWPRDLSVYYRDMKDARENYPYWDGVRKAAPSNCTFRSFTPTDKVTDLKRAGYPTGVVIQAEGDTQTAYPGGPAMADRLRDSLITVTDDGGHGQYGNNDCVSDLVDRYLVGGVVPATRATCAGGQRPDVPPDSAGTAHRQATRQLSLTDSVRQFLAEKQYVS